ncbi:MAG: hypothetical protein M3R55_14435 [Acidobacteriota bacterium]|nr:hypothetical protein [Acidobacteriota bacterium]
MQRDQGVSNSIAFISGDYFAAMGTPLKAGRLFNTDEQRELRRVIIISESMAQQAFPHGGQFV